MKQGMMVALMIMAVMIFSSAWAEEYSLHMDTTNINLATAISEGWILDKYYNDQADIYQGTYLRANQTDGRAYLKKAITVPDDTTAIVMKYTGALQNSYWGQNTGVFVILNNGQQYGFLSGMNSCCDYKDQHQLKIVKGWDALSHELLSLQYGVYNYTVIFSFEEITVQAKNEQGEIIYNSTVSAPGFDPLEVTELKYFVYTTTNNNSWMKDLSYSFVHHEKID